MNLQDLEIVCLYCKENPKTFIISQLRNYCCTIDLVFCDKYCFENFKNRSVANETI